MKFVPVYIFTGSSRKRVFNALEVLIGSLSSQFKDNRLLGADDMIKGLKPDLDAYKEMIDRFNIDPKTSIFVDDQEIEVDAASSLGMITFLIQNNSDETLIDPHVVISSVSELSNHLTYEDLS